MIHYVYETKNLVNGKVYVGVKTNSRHFDDGYFGSGKILQRAFRKYGLSNFSKTVLWSFGSPEEAFAKEAEIVDEEFVSRKDTYNVATGGKGGWLGEAVNEKRRQSLTGHVVSEETRAKLSELAKGNTKRRGAKWTDESKKKLSESCKGRVPHNIGKPHSKEAKAKMRKPHKSTGPKTRVSCIYCRKETTINVLPKHRGCK